MKQFSHEFKQHVTRNFFKKYFHGEKDEKSISVFKTSNSFFIKNDRILHFENCNHVNHLQTSDLHPVTLQKLTPQRTFFGGI